MSDYGIKICHGALNGLQDNPVSGSAYSQGGLEDAHFMRYVAFTFNSYRHIIWCHVIVLGFAGVSNKCFGYIIMLPLKQLYHIWLLSQSKNRKERKNIEKEYTYICTPGETLQIL